MYIKLSSLDKKILSQLQRDASLSAADLAKQVDSSPATCWRHIRRLEAEGLLGPQVRLVDPGAVGRTMDAFCQVKMKSQDAKARQEFQRSMSLEPTIVEVYSTSGEWDYLMHLLVKDMADLEDILMRRVLEHKNVAATATIFALRRVKHTVEVPV